MYWECSRARLAAVLFLTALLPSAIARETLHRGNSYRLRRSDPEGCEPESCSYFMGVNTNEDNSSYLDFYLVGEARGWVAVGFSHTPNKYDADVLGCSVDKDNRSDVVVMDTSNGGSPGGNNKLDQSEVDAFEDPEDIITYSAMYMDGRIMCNFSRLIPGIDPYPQDRNLNSSYFFIFAVSDEGRSIAGVEAFSPPEADPDVSKNRLNPTTSSGNIAVRTFKRKLIQGHAILMLIAWPMITLTGIFFATWMKPALPNGEWFQVHRAFNLAGLVVALVGFMLVFIAHKDQEPTGLIPLGKENPLGTSHFSIGVLIIAIQIINPIVSLFRCKPDGKYRWIFFVIHCAVLGFGLQILAGVNVGLGVSIFSEEESMFGDLTLLWIYLTFAVFTLLLAVLLSILFTVIGIWEREDNLKLVPAYVKYSWLGYKRFLHIKSEHFELVDSMSTEYPADPFPVKTPRKPPSRDAPLRWVALGVFLAVMLPFMITLIVLIAL